MPNPYLDYLINPSFQGVDRLFISSFENITDTTVHKNYYLPTVEIKDCNVMIDGQNFFDQPVESDLKTYEKLKLVKEMITLLVVCLTIIISKIIIKW